MEITKLFEQVSASDIRSLEDKLGSKLPARYVDFLLKHNGGFPSPNIFLINKKEKEDTLSLLFGISEGKSYDLWKNYILSSGEIPEGILPIGEDPGGNFICLGIVPENYGIVYFFDHETNNIIPVANDFDNFLNSLYSVSKLH